ncbi:MULTISPECIES: imidazolonepropionase [unclassified Lysobacter]|uniref:imidazolonepropionase n=1 Tax=unclassified Lysobacter TaxID=2635362 RepID=UPI001BE88540|nr:MULTISPECIES: imidazolonepropionase [unclassified Lysobacter]MBT2747088.1 imidazolonepropionase [Lysobacter sp. ISL-42]MBT2750451.1 imidazolonepropionase [Lysobacter sp. ISL-50]MBT2776297.1 imidazolonepropionase [Lysobacter sp. ISL-54]MBT2780792.1 imidazolonepropionase [Lysobacter sp. ISL-52]
MNTASDAPHRRPDGRLYDGLILGASLATLDCADGYGDIADAALAWRDGRIAWLGPRADLPGAPADVAETVIQAQGWITPGLIDCHTHLVFAGDRAREFELRLKGASYEEIARAGGGIVSSVRATRAADEAELLRQSLPRARALLGDGATTVEIKSGYGLDFDNERKMLRVARQVGDALGVQVRTTYLGAHALPPEYQGRADDYIDAVCEWMPRLHAQGLIDAVDAFCEGIGFSPLQTRRVFETARALGLPVKLHADQLSDLGGGALAAAFDGLSADHVEHTSVDSVKAMAAHGTVAVLLPGAFHVLRETKLPPLDAFREHGVAMAVATDCNPGTSPLLSLRQAMQLSCTHFRLTPEEALRGATVHAARALGLNDAGVLRVGARADFVQWDIGHPSELCYWLGGRLARRVVSAGRVLVDQADR